MSEIRFHREIYRAGAVDEALQVFAKFGTFERSDDGDHVVVKVTARTAARQRHLDGEFANYVLGATIKSGGAT